MDNPFEDYVNSLGSGLTDETKRLLADALEQYWQDNRDEILAWIAGTGLPFTDGMALYYEEYRAEIRQAAEAYMGGSNG